MAATKLAPIADYPKEKSQRKSPKVEAGQYCVRFAERDAIYQRENSAKLLGVSSFYIFFLRKVSCLSRF